MKKFVLVLAVLSVMATGCSSLPPERKSSDVENMHPALIDEEAASLGFPEYFISNEKDNLDWSKASPATVDGMNVEIVDTGAIVEVCGGLGCDK